MKVKVKSLSRVQLFATPWTVAHHVSPSMGFSRQEYWSGLPFPSPDGQYKNQIDYVLCSQRWRSSIESAKAKPGAVCGSDHEHLTTKFRLKFKRVGKTTRWPFRLKFKGVGKAIKWGVMKSLSRVQLFATPYIISYQAPPSMGFSRQEYWSGLPFPSPEDLPNPGIKPGSPTL